MDAEKNFTLGRRVKAGRRLLGISQKTFAQYCNVGNNVLARFEQKNEVTKANKKIIVSGLNNLGVIVLLDGVRFRSKSASLLAAYMTRDGRRNI